MPDYSEDDQQRILANAASNITASAEMRNQPTNTPAENAQMLRVASAQAEALLAMRGRVVELPAGDQRTQMLAGLDREITDTIGSLRQFSAYSGASNRDKIAQVRGIQALSARHADTEGVAVESKEAAQKLKSALHSEIATRLSPGIDALVKGPEHSEYESSLEDVERAIASKRNMGLFIKEDATKVLNLDPKPETVQRVQEQTASMRQITQQLRGQMSDDAMSSARNEMNQVRMGSSDTIQGKSGGGEVEGGVDKATQNWLNAAAFASKIAQSGQPITVAQIRELNRKLNEGMPANNGVPGEFRDKAETAGGGSQYPYPEHLEEMMDDFEKWFAENQHRDPIELAGMSYQKLVSIHPFDDANGRTCRLVVDAILESKGLPPASYVGKEVNVAAFGVPQGKTENVTPDEAIQLVGNAVERSINILQKHGVDINTPLKPELTRDEMKVQEEAREQEQMRRQQAALRQPAMNAALDVMKNRTLSFEALNIGKPDESMSARQLQNSSVGNIDTASVSRLTGDKIAGTLSLEGANLDTLVTLRGTFDSVTEGSELEASKMYARADELTATALVQRAYADIVSHVEKGNEPTTDQIKKLRNAVDALEACVAKSAALTTQVNASIEIRLDKALADKVGPVLDQQGFTQQEKASTLQAMTKAAMELDITKLRDVESHLESYAEQAATGVKESTFEYPGGGKVQNAVYRGFEAMAVKEQDGAVKIGSAGGGQTFKEARVNAHLEKAMADQGVVAPAALNLDQKTAALTAQLDTGKERMKLLADRFEQASLNNPPKEDAKLIAAIERLQNPDQPEVAAVIEAAGDAGLSTAQNDRLANLSRMGAVELRDRIDDLQVQVDTSREMVTTLEQRGDHIMADVLNAQANEAEQLVAVLNQVEQAKLSGQNISPQDLQPALASLKAASDAVNAVRVQADQDRRLLFQAQIAEKIGPQLDQMGLDANEKAVVVKTIADYSLDHDDLKPNVANAEGVAQLALDNLKQVSYQHEGAVDPSDQRIQDATRRALGLQQVAGDDGQVKVERPGVKNLQEEKFQATLESARSLVKAEGTDAVIGQQALSAGQQVKASLNARQQQSATAVAIESQNQGVAGPAAGQGGEEPANNQKRSVRDMLKGAASTVKSAVAYKLDINGSEQRLRDVPQDTQQAYKDLQHKLSNLRKLPAADGVNAIAAALSDPDAYQKFKNGSPQIEAKELEIKEKMDTLKKEFPGLAQLDRSKVGQFIHSAVRDASKSVGNKLS